MAELSATIAPEFLAACQAGAAEAGQALSRALGGELTLAVGESATYSTVTASTGFDGPGLVLSLTYGAAGLAIVVPESTGIVPAWTTAPDATGESKLSTLAQELSMLLAPESLMADKFEARRVNNVAAALGRAELASDAMTIALPLTGGGAQGALSLVWPLAKPLELFAAPAPNAGEVAPRSAVSEPPTKARKPQSFRELPPYAQSLLKIPVTVSVELATKKESLDEIVEIVSGSILKFDKGCDQLLTMVVGGQQVAVGEAVKVGEKFGFRITAMTLPPERFFPAQRPKAG